MAMDMGLHHLDDAMGAGYCQDVQLLAQQQLLFAGSCKVLYIILNPPNQLGQCIVHPHLQMKQVRLRGIVTCQGHKAREEVVRSHCLNHCLPLPL